MRLPFETLKLECHITGTCPNCHDPIDQLSTVRTRSFPSSQNPEREYGTMVVCASCQWVITKIGGNQ